MIGLPPSSLTVVRFSDWVVSRKVTVSPNKRDQFSLFEMSISICKVEVSAYIPQPTPLTTKGHPPLGVVSYTKSKRVSYLLLRKGGT